jgi:hypothetical protein
MRWASIYKAFCLTSSYKADSFLEILLYNNGFFITVNFISPQISPIGAEVCGNLRETKGRDILLEMVWFTMGKGYTTINLSGDYVVRQRRVASIFTSPRHHLCYRHERAAYANYTKTYTDHTGRSYHTLLNSQRGTLG